MSDLGSIQEFTVLINNTDVTNKVLRMEIFGEIFSIGWSCNINMLDIDNIVKKLGIKKFTEVTVKIKNESNVICNNNSKILSFYVMAINKQKYLNQNVQSFELVCVSSTIKDDLHKTIHKLYNNKNGKAIISDVVKEHFSNIQFTSIDDQFNKRALLQGKSPLAACLWVTQFIEYNGSPDCLLYASDIDKLELNSYEAMFNSQPIFNIEYQNHRILQNGEPNKDLPRSFIAYSISKFDAVKDLLFGHHAVQSTDIDLINKKATTNVFKMGDDNSNDKAAKNWDEETNTPVKKIQNILATEDSILNDSKWRSKRLSAILKMDQNKLNVQLYGSICITEKLGKVINVIVPPMEDMTKDMMDKPVSGNYVLASFKFIIEQNFSRINLGLIKKRLNK